MNSSPAEYNHHDKQLSTETLPLHSFQNVYTVLATIYTGFVENWETVNQCMQLLQKHVVVTNILDVILKSITKGTGQEKQWHSDEGRTCAFTPGETSQHNQWWVHQSSMPDAAQTTGNARNARLQPHGRPCSTYWLPVSASTGTMSEMSSHTIGNRTFMMPIRWKNKRVSFPSHRAPCISVWHPRIRLLRQTPPHFWEVDMERL